jgi:hypothetical protein
LTPGAIEVRRGSGDVSITAGNVGYAALESPVIQIISQVAAKAKLTSSCEVYASVNLVKNACPSHASQ